MSVRRRRRRDRATGTASDVWMIDVEQRMPDGSFFPRQRLVSPVQTKRGAEEYERKVRQAILDGTFGQERKEVPTFRDWFTGRYWEEWVIGRKNKPSTVEGKESIFRIYLDPHLGKMRLDEIGVGEVARFRAALVKKGLDEKYINNVLTVLSKPLRYAVDVEVIAKAPKVGMFKIEQPEIVFWDFAEYARLLAAARKLGEVEFAAVCLAGEAGLRVGEVFALRWREDVDLIARTLTVNQQIRKGVAGTPKGRTRRTLPMTETLYSALKGLSVVREGFVVRGLVGEAKDDENQVKNLAYRISRKAGLPERGWHTLRHSFATHAAMLGVNPWRLMGWLGHKLINETHRYVHVAEAHYREIPEVVLKAGEGEMNPDRRVLKQLAARIEVPVTPQELHGTMAAPSPQNDERPGESPRRLRNLA